MLHEMGQETTKTVSLGTVSFETTKTVSLETTRESDKVKTDA